VSGVPGSAGTIYLRDNAQPAGELIVDNGNVSAAETAPLRTGLATVRGISIANRGWLALDEAHRTVDWAQTITLNSGTLSAPDTIILVSATLRGVGTIATPLVNAGVVQPGSSPGVLVCAGGYAQDASGILEMELESISQFDHLHVVGAAQLDGQCAITYLSGFIPPPKSSYSLISFESRSGTFSDVSGIDTTRFTFAYGDTTAVLMADSTYVADIQPNRGGSDGPVTVQIYGLGFQSGSTPMLSKSGQPDIPGFLTWVAVDGRSLSTTFDLLGKAHGLWDVVVTHPGGFADTLRQGFTIESTAPVQVRVEVVGPERMRPNRPTAFHVILKNMGNTDLLNVPLWISRLPSDATVDLEFDLTSPPQEEGEPDWSAAPLTLDGPGGKYLALVIPRIKPGVTIRRFRLTVPNTITDFDLDAALTPPWADGQVFRACLSGGGVITAPACMGSQLTAINSYLATTPGVEALNGVGLWAKVAWQCEGATSLPAALAKAEEVLNYMLQPVEGSSVPSGCEVALVPWWQARRSVAVVTSVDPNDKFGANGVGPNRLIGADQLLPYVVQFENLATATAPVQELAVIDALDGATLDLGLGRVSLGAITFGDIRLEPPPGLTSYATQVDLRPGRNLLVNVSAILDRFSGVLSWYLASIDPATGQSPTDPMVGFLPPNQTHPEGEGSVLVTVLPKAGLAGGTVISNWATIDFDGVATPTAEWSNTVDTAPPQSRVLPLAATQDSASFTVRWEAEGAPEDLHAFTVYVAENGGRYRPWRVQTRVTADTIVAPGGRTYAFYSLAQDSSGNLEAVPNVPDAETFSRVAVEERTPLQFALMGAVPNPAVGGVRVRFTLASGEPATLELIDIAGRRVVRREVGSLGPGQHVVALGTSPALRAGLYFLRLVQGGRVLHARVAVIR
jgi:hypothetical protein